MIKLYRCLSHYAACIWKLSVKVRLLRGKEVRDRVGERFGQTTAPRPKGEIVWVHAASVGETLSILPVIERHPTMTFVVTTQTQTSAQILAQRNLQNVIHQFAPVDSRVPLQRFLTHWRPSLCLRVESELWPEAIMQVHEQGIPQLLVNARLSTRSARRWRLLRGAFQTMCSTFSCILTQSEVTTQNFQILAPNAPVKTAGNLKFLADPLPVDDIELSKLRTQTRGRTVWLAASTHPGEDEIILEAHKILAQTHPHTLTILVPRHVERAADIKALCQAVNLACTCRSDSGEALEKVYIADTMGELGLWYRLAPVSLIAGSLRPNIGGHNLIEAAQLQTVIISGPHVSSARDLYGLFLQQRAALQAATPEEIAQYVVSVWEGKPDTQGVAKRAYALTQQTGDLLRMLENEINTYLPQDAKRA